MEQSGSHVLTSLVDENDVREIIQKQRKTLRKYEEVNELVKRFNDVADRTYQDAQVKFTNHVKVLCNLKKDLDLIYRRIRALKVKLKQQYPPQFMRVADAIQELSDQYSHLDENGDLEVSQVNTIKETELDAYNAVENKICDNVTSESKIDKMDDCDEIETNHGTRDGDNSFYAGAIDAKCDEGNDNQLSNSGLYKKSDSSEHSASVDSSVVFDAGLSDFAPTPVSINEANDMNEANEDGTTEREENEKVGEFKHIQLLDVKFVEDSEPASD